MYVRHVVENSLSYTRTEVPIRTIKVSIGQLRSCLYPENFYCLVVKHSYVNWDRLNNKERGDKTLSEYSFYQFIGEKIQFGNQLLQKHLMFEFL